MKGGTLKLLIVAGLIILAGYSSNAAWANQSLSTGVTIIDTPSYVFPVEKNEVKKDLIIPLKPKWVSYNSYEDLANDVSYTLMIPGNLPRGLALTRIQYMKDTQEVVSIYSGEERELVFLQKPKGSELIDDIFKKVDIQGIPAKWFKTGQGLIVTWQKNNEMYELKGQGLTLEEMVAFGNSLFPHSPVFKGAELKFREIATSWHMEKFEPEKKTALVFADKKDLQTFAQEHGISLERLGSVKENEIYIGVFAGQKPSGRYGVLVKSARVDKDRWVILFEETAPSPNTMVPEVITHPFQFVAVEIPQWELKEPESVLFVSSTGEAIANLSLKKYGYNTESGVEHEKVAFSEAERTKLAKLIGMLPPTVKEEFETKYVAWKKTWEDPKISMQSNPRAYAQSQQYREFFEYCKKQGEAIWPLLIQKLEQGETFIHIPILDVTLTDPANEELLAEIRKKSAEERYTSEGVYIVPSGEDNMMKYVKELLAKLEG
ncbi:MAG: protease complex subunit PrcB family protein [Peptococcaceae bacterium]|jgi:hypothetical protein|nr:protease complex subunit PrcB family protein [Peptococcaceae bacterium]MDH7524468.1 protease complex subunit PrcB family protein [Peptococcaceae bacterium]